MVDRSSLNHYSAASTRAVELAKRDLQRFWNRLDLTNPDKARDALLEFIPTLVDTYGDLVATAAMEWYDEERAKIASLPGYRASVDIYTTSTDQAVAVTRYAASHLYTNNPHQALAVLEGTVHRLIKDAGRDVIARNVKLDPAHPRYARVPRGAKTCAWCSILASRGWVYVSKESANLHGKGHDHCDCELVPSWKAHDEYIKGYDPDAEYARYEEARHAVAVEGGDPNDLKAIAAKARSLHPEAYTDGHKPEKKARASRDGTLSEKKWTNYRQELAARIEADGVARKLPPKEIPEAPQDWPEDLPILTSKAWAHILYGNGSAKHGFRGGHLPGYGWVAGGSEFPTDWTPRDVQDAAESLLQGVSEGRSGKIRGSFRGITLEAWISVKKNGDRSLSTIHPVGRRDKEVGS